VSHAKHCFIYICCPQVDVFHRMLMYGGICGFCLPCFLPLDIPIEI
jgi:hypothetical protein